MAHLSSYASRHHFVRPLDIACETSDTEAVLTHIRTTGAGGTGWIRQLPCWFGGRTHAIAWHWSPSYSKSSNRAESNIYTKRHSSLVGSSGFECPSADSSLRNIALWKAACLRTLCCLTGLLQSCPCWRVSDFNVRHPGPHFGPPTAGALSTGHLTRLDVDIVASCNAVCVVSMWIADVRHEVQAEGCTEYVLKRISNGSASFPNTPLTSRNVDSIAGFCACPWR